MTTNNASAMKLILLLCSLVCIANCNAETITNDNPRACKSTSGDNPLTFEVLSGMGWDNLANEERGMVINLNYSQCRTTDDGTYLIPDDVHVIPIKSSQMSVFSKVYDHWSNYESDTSGSVNAGGSFKGFGYKIAGSMSAEFQSNRLKTRPLRRRCRQNITDILLRCSLMQNLHQFSEHEF